MHIMHNRRRVCKEPPRRAVLLLDEDLAHGPRRAAHESVVPIGRRLRVLTREVVAKALQAVLTNESVEGIHDSIPLLVSSLYCNRAGKSSLKLRKIFSIFLLKRG